MTKRPCKACQKRRKLLEAKLLAKQAKGKRVQAAAIGAVLAVTEAVGQSLGIGEDTEDGARDSGITEPSSSGSREDRGQPGG